MSLNELKDRLISVPTAAREKGCGRGTIYKAMNRGNLSSIEIAGRRLVLRDLAYEEFVPGMQGFGRYFKHKYGRSAAHSLAEKMPQKTPSTSLPDFVPTESDSDSGSERSISDMSQRSFDTENRSGEPVRVTSGWDTALERHFLLIDLLDEPGGDDIATLFSNLDRKKESGSDPGMKLWQITNELARRGLPYPPHWIRAVAADRHVSETPNRKSDAGGVKEHFGHIPNPARK